MGKIRIIIESSPFLAFGITLIGVHFENALILVVGGCCFIFSFFSLLLECGSDFKDEIERSNNKS